MGPRIMADPRRLVLKGGHLTKWVRGKCRVPCAYSWEDAASECRFTEVFVADALDVAGRAMPTRAGPIRRGSVSGWAGPPGRGQEAGTGRAGRADL